jgi:hypothetical protein
MTGPKKSGKVNVASVKRVKVVAAPPKRRKAPKQKSSGTLKGWGGVVGSYLGGPVGGMVGQAAGSLISKITGFGDYKVNSNSIVKGNSVPTFRNDADGMVVCHREFLRNITGTVAFNLNSIAINPGLSESFPLLALLTQSFEEYEMDGLVFEYRPSSGSAVSSTSSALGVVILATDYDAANPLFANKQQMESYEYSTSTVPFAGCIHPVECKRSRNVLDNLYVRTTAQPSGTDIRMYDMGNFQYATEGMQSSYVVGELWVSYDCRLRKPRLPAQVFSSDHLRVITRPAGSANDQLLFGTSPPFHYETSDSDLAMFGVSTANTSWTCKFKLSGDYMLQYAFFATTSAAACNFTLTSGVNLAAGPNILRGNTVPLFSTSGALFYNLWFCIRCVASGTGVANDFTLTINSGAATLANSDLQVWRIGVTAPLLDPLEPPPAVVKTYDVGLLSNPVQGLSLSTDQETDSCFEELKSECRLGVHCSCRLH